MSEIDIKTIEKPEPDKEWALLYGVLLGDGCLCKHKRKNRKNSFNYAITITGHHIDDKEFFNFILKPLIDKLRNKQTNYRIVKEQGKIEFNFSDKILFHKIHSFKFPIGKKKNLHIPNNFYKFMPIVISGLFSTDGCLAIVNNNGTKYPRLIIKMTAKRLLKQVFNYLINTNLKGNFYLAKSKKWPNNRQPQYWICFNGKENMIKFNNIIGFINPKQKIKYDTYLKSASSRI